MLNSHGCPELNPYVDPKVFWFTTHVSVGLEITGSGLRVDDRLVIVRKGLACSNDTVTDKLDSEIQGGCPGACEWFGWPDETGKVGIKLGAINGLRDGGVGIVGIEVLNSTRIIVRFNGSVPPSLSINDRLVIDTSTITCTNQVACGIITGLLDVGGNCRQIHGNRITIISGRDTVELLSSIPIPPSDIIIKSPIHAWERVNRYFTEPELRRLSPVVDLRVCLLSHTGTVLSAGSVSFQSAPAFEKLEFIPASAAADVTVPGKLVLQGIVPQTGKVNLKLVLPFVSAFDILGSNSPADLAEHVVPCETFVTRLDSDYSMPPIEYCSMTQFGSQRKEVLLSFSEGLTIPNLNITVVAQVGKSLSSSLVGQVHVFHSSNPFNLLQFGFITFKSTPTGVPILSASRWAPFSGLSISSPTGFVDLRTSNGTFSIVLSGGALEISAIRNGTVIRIIGWKDMDISVLDCSVCTSGRAVILESQDSDSIRFRYNGPHIWGSVRVTLTLRAVDLAPSGFLPIRLYGELSSDTGIDLTRSVGAQIWCSPSLNNASIITASFGTVSALFPNEPARELQLKLSFPWILPGASVIVLDPPENIATVNMYVLPKWSLGRLALNVSLVGTGVSESVPVWKFRIQTSSVEIGPLLFTGALPWVMSHLDSVRIERISRNFLWVWFACGQSNSRLRKSISISPRLGSWNGRRTCSVSPVADPRYYTSNSRIGQGGCEMDSSGDITVHAKSFRAGTRYLFRLELGDDRWGSQVLDLTIRDQDGAPLEGESGVPVVGQQQEECARILFSPLSSVWVPNTVGELNVSLWLVPGVTYVELKLEGVQVVWRDVEDHHIQTNGSRTLSVTRPVRIQSSVDYSVSQSLVVRCGGNISSRALLPPVAEVFDMELEPVSWIASRNVTIGARFDTNFYFSTAWIESTDLTPNRLLLTGKFSQVSAAINLVSNNRTEIELVLGVDDFRVSVAKPLVLYGPVDEFLVSGTEESESVLIQLQPSRTCRRPCKVAVYGPSGTEFSNPCVVGGLRSTLCSSFLDELVLDVNQTLPNGQWINFTLGVNLGVISGMWRIVVGSDQVGEYMLTRTSKTVTGVQVVGRCNGIAQLNIVDVYFNSSGPGTNPIIHFDNSGFSKERMVKSEQGHAEIFVRNPAAKSQSMWSLQVDDLIVPIPAPLLVNRLQSLRVAVSGHNFTLLVETTDSFIPGDVLVIQLPEGLSIRCPLNPISSLFEMECSGSVVKVKQKSLVMSPTTELVISLELLPSAYQEGDLNLLTAQHVRDNVDVIACGSILSPKITASIPSMAIQSVGRNRSCGSLTDILLSFNATFSGSSVEIIAVSPIGFDFRNSGLKHAVRIAHAFGRNDFVDLKVSGVQLPPFSGRTVFTVKTYNMETVVSEQLVEGFSIPSKLRIASIRFSGNGRMARFGGESIDVWISVDGLSCSQVEVDPIPLFGPIRNLTVNSSHVGFSATTPLEPVQAVDIGISCTENGTIVSTNDAERISLIGKIAETLQVTVATLSRVAPNMVIHVNVSVQARWMYDSVEVIPPDGFDREQEYSSDLRAWMVRTPRATPPENIWEIRTRLSDGSVIGSGQISGFEIPQLTDTMIVYPALPSRQVAAPVLMGVKFSLSYPTSAVRLVRLSLPPQTSIVIDERVTFDHIPVSSWDTSESVLNLWVNETLLARDYAFSLHVIQSESRIRVSNVSVELLGSAGEVVDACYTLHVNEIQYGLSFAPSVDSTLFRKDDQSSVLDKNLNLTTQETSSILVAQLSSFREVFPFRLFGTVLAQNITLIRITFPDRVVLNRGWMHKDPEHVGFMGTPSIASRVEAVEYSKNCLRVTLSSDWTDITSSDFYLSVPVTLPQNEPLPAFNFYQVSFVDTLNRTLSTFVFKGHKLNDEPSNIDIAQLFAANSTSGVIVHAPFVLFPVFVLLTL